MSSLNQRKNAKASCFKLTAPFRVLYLIQRGDLSLRASGRGGLPLRSSLRALCDLCGFSLFFFAALASLAVLSSLFSFRSSLFSALSACSAVFSSHAFSNIFFNRHSTFINHHSISRTTRTTRTTNPFRFRIFPPYDNAIAISPVPFG